MNYTEKYHLPQWEETDRIMRTDFNQMCADIESGLGAGRTDCAEKTAELRDYTLDCLFRAARNHYHLVTSETTMPRQTGVFRQVFDGSVPLSGGMIQKDGYAWMTWEGKGFTSEEFRAGLKMETRLETIPSKPEDSTPLTLTFTARGAGRFEELTFFIYYTVAGAGNCTYSLSVKDLTTGGTISGARFTDNTRTGGNLSKCSIYPNINLRAGHKYQIKLTTVTAPVSAFVPAETHFGLNVTSYYAPKVTLVHQFSEQEGSQGGMVLVRYKTSGRSSSAVLRWDGICIDPTRVRTVTDEKGRSLQEAEYRRADTIPAESSLELCLTCGEREEISFYEWGAILI